MLNTGGLVRDAYETGLPRAVAGVAVIWQLTIFIQVLAYLGDYRHPLIPLAAWAAMLGAAAWLVPRARRGRLGRADAALAVAVAVGVVALVGWQRKAGASGSVDWSVAGTCWLLALIALCRPAWECAAGAVLMFGTHAIFAVRVLGVTALDQARLATTGYTVLLVLAVFAALRPAVAAHARIAARRADLASQAAAQRAAAAAIQRDRGARLRLLEEEALPLLRGIADRTLDPADPEVVRRCAHRAATLRRALAGAAPPGGLVEGLQPALRAARDRGVAVEMQVIGRPGAVDGAVLEATTHTVGMVTARLPPQPVTLTIVAAGAGVELYLTFAQPPDGVADVAGAARLAPPEAGWRAALDADEGGPGCLEIRWRNEPG
jgi:hypothetical protein